METPCYQYQPLQHSDSLRILVLHPSLDATASIACTISHIQISDKSLEYEAISYTWGESTQTNTIFLNDGREKLVIGNNCYAALRRLRLVDEDRTVWIDAVCINQEDPYERGHQVRMMSDVYSFASGVMVMLRDQVPDCRLLLDRLTEINNLLESGAIIARFRPNPVISQQLETLFKDPWFKRTWVLQEVHAKSLVTIMYGPATISFKALEKLFIGYYDILARTPWPLPLQLVYRTETAQYLTPQAGLWNRLYGSRECLASNPRDKIFALKSLIGETQSAIDHLIDYTQSVESCFTEVAKFLLPVVELRILCAVRHPHNLNMASWIPDWSQNLPLQHKAFNSELPDLQTTVKTRLDESLVKLLGELPEYRSIKPSNRSLLGHSPRPNRLYQESSTHPELYVRGCLYSQIEECGRVFQFCDFDDAEKQLRDIFNSFHGIRLYLDRPSKHDVASAFDHFSQNIRESKLPNCLHHCRINMTKAMSDMDGHRLYYNFSRGESREWSSSGDGDRVGRSDALRIHNFSPRRDIKYLYEALQLCKICLMQNGKLVIVPNAAECGDIVCISENIEAPLLLRSRQDGCWSLVSGDCYIFDHGIQSQEELSMYVKSHKKQEEKLTIR